MELHGVMGSSPPLPITQEAFEGDPAHLQRLGKLHPGERADARDLWEYTQDLLYTDIQGSLLVYLLPFCLELWREDLLGKNRDVGGFVEQFYPVLANRQVFDKLLKPAQTAAVSQFMRETILEEIDNQRGLSYAGMGARPYRWINAVTTYGILFPSIDRLWKAWWNLGTVGSAISGLQYISCLMYEERENPIFAPWTADRGGGPPCLWEFEGHLYTHRWLQENVQFLRGVLNPDNVADLLNRAVEVLIGESEQAIAIDIQKDLPLCTDMLVSRCKNLPCILETTQQPNVLLDWSTPDQSH